MYSAAVVHTVSHMFLYLILYCTCLYTRAHAMHRDTTCTAIYKPFRTACSGWPTVHVSSVTDTAHAVYSGNVTSAQNTQ